LRSRGKKNGAAWVEKRPSLSIDGNEVPTGFPEENMRHIGGGFRIDEKK